MATIEVSCNESSTECSYNGQVLPDFAQFASELVNSGFCDINKTVDGYVCNQVFMHQVYPDQVS